jgi:hypothetical protein
MPKGKYKLLQKVTHNRPHFFYAAINTETHAHAHNHTPAVSKTDDVPFIGFTVD